MSAEIRRRQKRRLCEAQNWRCAHCGLPLEYETATIDHVHPRGAGGPDTLANKVIACEPCNVGRSNWTKLPKHARRTYFRKIWAMLK